MADRRVYRGIEEAALLGGFRDSSFPHSVLARRLRYAYRASRDLMVFDLESCQMFASIHGNTSLNARKGFDMAKSAMNDARGRVYPWGAKVMSTLSRGVEALKRLEAMPREAWKAEYDRIALESEDGEVHVLGGKDTAMGSASPDNVVS